MIDLESLAQNTEYPVDLRSGKYLIAGSVIRVKDRIFINFPYNKNVLSEVKSFERRKYHGFDDVNPRKIWSFPITQRNLFKWAYLNGANPYADFDKPLVTIDPRREVLRDHQIDLYRFAATRRMCILAAEMGTGKTLVAIELMEWFKREFGLENEHAWYVGPRSGVTAVSRELIKWQSLVQPRMFTYNKLVTEMRSWIPGRSAPQVVIFDESSKLKTPTAQRTQQAQHLADSMREEYGRDCLIVLMTGSPSPKSPVDWWSQCEVACPGFVKEGNIHEFKKRLCLVKEVEGLTGSFPKIITWWDDKNKCSVCGQTRDEHAKDAFADHPFQPSENEVAKLYRRMDGLVTVLFKKDCTDLPEKQYEIIRIKPTVAMLRASKLIRQKAPRVVTALSLLRELSDGFQYEDIDSGETKVCPTCDGTGSIQIPQYEGDVDFQDSKGLPESVSFVDGECPECGGEGKVTRYIRSTKEVSSPKDQVFIDLLDEHSEIGRFVVWGGFQGTVDRIVRMAHQQGWATLRVDGRGYVGEDSDGTGIDSDTLLSALDRSSPNFHTLKERYPRVCFVGHPQAGGMALTLTASPTALYYSNSFSGEARVQSEDRIHRLGMDENRGAKIIDLVMLPSDQMVIDNLKKKKKLQSLTMGQLDAQWEAAEREV